MFIKYNTRDVHHFDITVCVFVYFFFISISIVLLTEFKCNSHYTENCRQQS